MSNQVYSNNILEYNDQSVTINVTGRFLFSILPFVGVINLRKNGNTVTMKILSDNSQTCQVTEKAIEFGAGCIPPEFRPQTASLRPEMYVYMNAGNSNVIPIRPSYKKQFTKWVIQTDGNVVITNARSNYPNVPLNDPATPALDNENMGLTPYIFQYTLT